MLASWGKKSNWLSTYSNSHKYIPQVISLCDKAIVEPEGITTFLYGGNFVTAF